MSYDLHIRADAAYSQAVTLERVAALLAGLPAVRGQLFSDPDRDLHMNLDPAWVAAEQPGVWLPSSPAGQINVISCHIPYSKLHDDASDDSYFILAQQIAAALGWEVYDCQLDRTL